MRSYLPPPVAAPGPSASCPAIPSRGNKETINPVHFTYMLSLWSDPRSPIRVAAHQTHDACSCHPACSCLQLSTAAYRCLQLPTAAYSCGSGCTWRSCTFSLIIASARPRTQDGGQRMAVSDRGRQTVGALRGARRGTQRQEGREAWQTEGSGTCVVRERLALRQHRVDRHPVVAGRLHHRLPPRRAVVRHGHGVRQDLRLTLPPALCARKK